MPTHTAVQIFFSFNTDGIKYYDLSTYRLRGEWKVINCDVYNRAYVSFGFWPANKSEKYVRSFPVPTEKIKLVSRNVYNVTRLAYKDSGQYICEMMMNTTDGDVTRHYTRHSLFVLEEGKTYMDCYKCLCK